MVTSMLMTVPIPVTSSEFFKAFRNGVSSSTYFMVSNWGLTGQNKTDPEVTAEALLKDLDTTWSIGSIAHKASRPMNIYEITDITFSLVDKDIPLTLFLFLNCIFSPHNTHIL